MPTLPISYCFNLYLLHLLDGSSRNQMTCWSSLWHISMQGILEGIWDNCSTNTAVHIFPIIPHLPLVFLTLMFLIIASSTSSHWCNERVTYQLGNQSYLIQQEKSIDQLPSHRKFRGILGLKYQAEVQNSELIWYNL